MRWSLSIAALATAVALHAPARADDGHPPHSPTAAAHGAAKPAEQPTPDEALQRLVEGNHRFAAGTSKHKHVSPLWRKGLESSQHPFATILGCADSRVPTELVFDQGFGDLFVVRVAGNVVAADDQGSIEYAIHHLSSPLVIVMGHESCGAVTAALLPEAERQKEPKAIQDLLNLLVPSFSDLDPTLVAEARIHQGVEANVRHSVRQLLESPVVKERVAEGKLKVVGGVYELKTGKVRLLQ